MRKLLVIAISVFFILGSGAFYLRWFGGKLLQSTRVSGASPIAEVRKNPSLSALDSDYISVELRSGRFAMPSEVFGATTYGGTVQAHWHNASNLVITLLHPSDLRVYSKETVWRNVTISYEESN